VLYYYLYVVEIVKI